MLMVDADDLEERLERVIDFGVPDADGKHSISAEAVLDVIEKSAVEAVPVVHGRWETGSDTQCGISCSVCGMPVDDFCGSIDYIFLKYEPNFCPHCGAVMDGKGGEQI